MATTKHLDPTNVDISIPAMTDQPNASVFSNCVDKEADAINSLNSKITTNEVSSFFTIDSTKITIDNSSNCHKVGNIVCISLDITAKNEVNGTAYIGTLAESIKPRKSVYGVLCDYTNKTTVTPFALQADGRIIVYNLVSGHEFLGSVCYEVE